ncbi:MAG: hypothetical protein AUH30_14315 [Candidatus Rokubacteria bacterium 13_1_40CM_68_15]|nr:MAG: hypothetical protein AUH30_14315 [Candidatus Rokubacteria bacterium 13_1_40CM_68_15]
MSLEKRPPHFSVIDVYDRVLDKGLVMDARLHASVAGIELVSVRARIVVASIPTYVKSFSQVGESPCAARPTSPASLPPAAQVTPRPSPRRPPRRLRTCNVRCGHGCTFALKRGSTPSTIACPFDGGRKCAVTPAPAV